MLTAQQAAELPVSTAHATNRYHDKVEINKQTLVHMAHANEKYKKAIQNSIKFAEAMQEEVMFLTKDEAQLMAKHACDFIYEAYIALGYPVLSCTGKAVKGSSFYKAKVLIKFDTSG